MFTHLRYVTLGKTYSSLGLHLVPIFIFREPYCLNPYRAFYVWSFESLVVDHLKRSASPSFADISHKKNPTTHFKSLRLSALYIGIYLFFERKKKKDRVRFEMTWREHKTDPASLRGVNGIYSVYFLHAVHINPQRCQYTAHIMFQSALVFQGNINHDISHTKLPKRDITFSES